MAEMDGSDHGANGLEWVRRLLASSAERRWGMAGGACIALAVAAPDWLAPEHVLNWGRTLLVVGGALSFARTAWLVYRLRPPRVAAATPTPIAAVRGPLPFTEGEADLFARLSRDREIAQLRSAILDERSRSAGL